MPRGRPKKDAINDKPKVDKPKAKKKVDKPVYNHTRYAVCTSPMNHYPTFLNQARTACGARMDSVKTTDGGKVKHYKCTACGATKKLEGELV